MNRHRIVIDTDLPDWATKRLETITTTTGLTAAQVALTALLTRLANPQR